MSSLSLLPLVALLVPDLLLRDVTLVDATSPAARPGRDVLVVGGRIAAVRPTGELEPPAGVEVVEGGFVIPGLFDMHVHLDLVGEEALPLLVAHGITSVRDLGGDLEVLDGWVERVERGELVGPRVARAGFVVESRTFYDMVLSLPIEGKSEEDDAHFARTRIPIETEDDVLEALGRIVDSGADLVKVRTSAPAPIYERFLREARLAGLRVAAHEPQTVALPRAIELGIGSVEHLPLASVMRGVDDAYWARTSACRRSTRAPPCTRSSCSSSSAPASRRTRRSSRRPPPRRAGSARRSGSARSRWASWRTSSCSRRTRSRTSRTWAPSGDSCSAEAGSIDPTAADPRARFARASSASRRTSAIRP